MSEELKCHICGELTEFTCQTCEEPVCEDCCVQPTYLNQLEETLCTACGDSQECDRWDEAHRQSVIDDAAQAKRNARNEAAKARYWKPENVKKRKLAIIERKRLRAEAYRESWARAGEIVGGMMRGM
jgi:hypothetical protein